MKKIIALLALVSLPAFAELPQELAMKTDVGKVALTIKECPVKNTHGFSYSAYATEFNKEVGGQVIHKGCWSKDGDVVSIWFYDEDPPLVATYKDYHFKPEPNL